jgi:hypothetical protein
MTMKRKNLVLAAVIALVSAALAGTALAQVPQAQTQSPAFNAQQYGRGGDFGQNHDGTGWNSQRERFRAMDLDGRWVADGRDGNAGWDRSDFRGRGPMKGVRLPDVIRIDQQPSRVKIADGGNHLLQLVMLGGKFDSRHGGDRPDYLTGSWNGRTLVVQHPMPRGDVTQTFALVNRGTTLVVKTRREGFGPRTMEVTTTYHRA